MPEREHEHTLNIALAKHLRSRGLDAKGERIQTGARGRRMDVAVRIGPVTVAVEAEHGQSSGKKREAIRDADNRLSQRMAHCAVAVCYPDDTDEDSLPDARLTWTIRPDDDEITDWTEGDIDGLASVIRLAPAQLGDPDAAAASLSATLDGAVNRLSVRQKRMLAKALDLPPGKLGRGSRAAAARWDKPAKRALLVVATAVMFHSRLDIHLIGLRPEQDNRRSPPVPFRDDWPPSMARSCAYAADPVAAFHESWNLILALDYKPIFDTANAALFACPADPAFADAIRETAKAALAVAQNIASLRHDLLGRIFHTVLDTARYDGSFYTTTAAATLLATLAINEEMCDWTDPASIAKLRITDPACGTGTLLMAAAERIHDLAPQSRDDGALARALIEDVLSGYDVNLTATHMAATTLGLLSPTTHFRNMKIGRAFLGVDDTGDAFLGSLEFLDQKPKLLSWPNAEQPVSQIDSGDRMTQADPADLVIMNPPFTRDSLRHDQFSKGHESKLKDREKQLLGNKPVHLTNIGSAFVVLADYIRKSENGAIATILPLVAATNKSGLKTRQFIGRNYYVETIVTSHDPERIYFSENTDIGEMLLVCRKWDSSGGTKPPTRIVNLAKNPATPADAIGIAWAIENNTVQSQGIGTIQQCSATSIELGDWGAVQFLSEHLRREFCALREGMFPSSQLGKIAEIGPDGRGIRGACNRSSMPSPDGMVALWYHKTDVTQSMSARIDTQLTAKPGKKRDARRLWKRRARLMLPYRMRLNTVRALSVRLNTPALGSLWTPCKPDIPKYKKSDLEKALCAYFNSSIGVLAILGDRTNKIPSYPELSMDDLSKLIVPDFTVVGRSSIRRMVAAYDSTRSRTLLPLSYMDTDPVRRALDDAVSVALDIDDDEVATIRRHLAAEPSVTGERYRGSGA